MALPQARHDALFRLLVSDPHRAGRLLRDYLPTEVVSRLDPEHPPVHVESTAIDGEGSRTQADAIFRAHLRDGSEAIVYTLLEHKAQADHRTPLQLIRYMLNIWAMEIDSGTFPDGGLPLIIPMVFFHGREPWTVPCSIQEMIDTPEGLEHLAQSFGRYMLHDLGRIAPQNLSRGVEVRAALLALARAFRENVSDAEADLLVAGVAETDFGRYILTYIIEQVSLPPERIEAALRRAGTDTETLEEIMGTAAQIWMEQGKAAGIVEGKAAGIVEGKAAGIVEGKAAGVAEGKAAGIMEAKTDTFLRLARLKFGELSSAQTEQVRNASPQQLDSWLEALLNARDIDGVLGERTRH